LIALVHSLCPSIDTHYSSMPSGTVSHVYTPDPMSYLLAALRSLLYGGWPTRPLLQGFAATVGVDVASLGLALAALRGRVARG